MSSGVFRIFAGPQGFFIWSQKSLIPCVFSQILNFPSQMHFHAALSRQMKMPCAGPALSASTTHPPAQKSHPWRRGSGFLHYAHHPLQTQTSQSQEPSPLRSYLLPSFNILTRR